MIKFAPLRFLSEAPWVAVGILSFVFSLLFVPWTIINPFSTAWVFVDDPASLDMAQSAIGSMLFSSEDWHLPLGAINSLAQEIGSSLYTWNAVPLLAYPSKLLVSVGILPVLHQTIGIQLVIGFTFTPVFVFLLSKKLGATTFFSSIFSISSLFCIALISQAGLPNLSWQFLSIIPMILAYDVGSTNWKLRWWLYWPLCFFVSSSVHPYFIPIGLVFLFIASARFVQFCEVVGWVRKAKKFASLILPSSAALLVSLVLGGAFLVPASKVGTDSSTFNAYTSDFFGPLTPNWVETANSIVPIESIAGSNFIGILATVFVLIGLAGFLLGENLSLKRGFFYTFCGSLALYLVALGTEYRFFGSAVLQIPVPHVLEQALSVFRVLGRFSWPMMYLLIAFGSLVASTLISKAKHSRIKSVFVYLLVVGLSSLTIVDALPLMGGFNKLLVTTGNLETRNFELASKEIERIELYPAYDGDIVNIPWRSAVGSGFENKYELANFGYLARYDFDKAIETRLLSNRRFETCQMSLTTAYMIRGTDASRFSKLCSLDFKRLSEVESDWSIGVFSR